MNLPPKLVTEFPGRLTTLCDGRTGLRGGLAVEVQGSPASCATLDFIASSESPDRYQEIISAAGWRLENYQRNPVFQNAHQYGDIIFTLGRALITEVRMVEGRPVLFQRVEFATDINPMARIAYGLYKGKFLNAVSVGFIPIRWQNADGTEKAFSRKYLEQELLEVSAVGIPANPEALALGLKSGAIDASDLREFSELLQALAGRNPPSPAVNPEPDLNPNGPVSGESLEFRFPIFSNQADPHTYTSALGVRNYEAQLLQLARDLRDALT